MSAHYVHGYSRPESARLSDQAITLSRLLHHDTAFPAGALVLEAGCGVGAQSLVIARGSPDARFISFDVRLDSVREARARLSRAGVQNVALHVADVRRPPFRPESFDHVFVCFLLEHLPGPTDVLIRLKSLLKPGGRLTIIEGDHGSAFFHPRSGTADRAIQCLVELQARADGDALIGRRLFALLNESGFQQAQVSPRVVYADAGHPEMVDGFTRKTFIAMIESIRVAAIESGLMTAEDFDQGIADLERTTAEDGSFSYTFFKGTGVK